MTVSSKIRLYDLAKELKLDTKRLIEEVRREGVDVSVPSIRFKGVGLRRLETSISPKKETTPSAAFESSSELNVRLKKRRR